MSESATVPRRKTMREFCSRYGISATAEWADANPYMTDKEWSRQASHYKVRLKRRDPQNRVRRSLTTYFSMGYAHTKEPTAIEVLDCLASDAGTTENNPDFESWARELGYDDDSRKAERTYRVVSSQTERLKRFLGDDRYQELLWNTERE